MTTFYSAIIYATLLMCSLCTSRDMSTGRQMARSVIEMCVCVSFKQHSLPLRSPLADFQYIFPEKKHRYSDCLLHEALSLLMCIPSI